MLVLDTSAYSHLRSGDSAVIDHLAEAESILLPVVVLGELEAGFRRGSRLKENHQALRDFLAEPGVRTLEVTEEVALRYGLPFAQLRSASTPLPTNDVWIAATASVCGGHLLTFDRDFESIPGLAVTVLVA